MDYSLAIEQLKHELKETHGLTVPAAEVFDCRDTTTRERMVATWFNRQTPYEITTPAGQTVAVPIPSDDECATLEAAARQRIESQQFVDPGNDHENVKSLAYAMKALMQLTGVSNDQLLAAIEQTGGAGQRARTQAMIGHLFD